MIKLNPIASNQTELEKPDGTIVFYSYATPVAAFVPGQGGLATTKKYSRTTSRHITLAIRRWSCSRTDVDQAVIEKLADC